MFFFQNRYPIMVKCLNIGKNIGKPIYRSISRKYPPHHYTTTLNHWDKAGWIHAFMFFTPNSDPTIWMSQKKSAVAHLLQGLTCCAFRDGILHTLVVTSGYLSYCYLSIISNSLPILLCSLTSSRHFRLAPTTTPRSKSLKTHFFPILMLGLNFSKSSSPHLDA